MSGEPDPLSGTMPPGRCSEASEAADGHADDGIDTCGREVAHPRDVHCVAA